MHYQPLTTLAFLTASLAAAVPAPLPPSTTPGISLHPRALTWTNQPSTEPKCLNTATTSPDTAAYENSDIEAAIQAAVNAIVNNELVYSSKTPYPHRNTPGNAQSSKDSWADYDLSGCAQGGSDTATKAGFVEFPISRQKTVYTGGNTGAGSGVVPVCDGWGCECDV